MLNVKINLKFKISNKNFETGNLFINKCIPRC